MPFIADDVIILNGDDKDFEIMKSKMEARRLAAKLAKKDKKRSKTAAAVDGEPAVKTVKTKTKEDKEKAAAKGGPKGGKSKSDKTKSVQNDPKASETYKNLFTSCDEAKKQGAQHSGWVSFNPQYFR